MSKVVVIGAGVGGLTSAAILARAGLDVAVLEAHVYAGGSAGTFFHKGYRFDAGATLAGGFYPGGPMDIVAQASGIDHWPVHHTPADDQSPAMIVHLPGGGIVPRWTDDRRHAEYRAAFGPAGERFFQWQEKTADALWDFALRNPPWPPQILRDIASLIGNTSGWLAADFRRLSPALIADAFRTVAAHLKNTPENLRQFVDAQLLISAQTTSEHANALYGASALELPRRGVAHLKGGMGAIADTLVKAVRANGGQVIFRQEVTRIILEKGIPIAVETKRRQTFPADLIIANLPPWNIVKLLGEHTPRKLQNLPPQPKDCWGAFVAYIGLDESVLPADFAMHHQLVTPEVKSNGWGEGATVFLSLSPAGDSTRAPKEKRAMTMSTHTALRPWWDLFDNDRPGYDHRKKAYLDRMLDAAERVIPGLRDAVSLVMPGTPVTFQQFTRREFGWVGGFPQTSLFRAWGPRLAPGLWMVGDSIFPGQSTAAVALGGVRVARSILQTYDEGELQRMNLNPGVTFSKQTKSI